MGPRPLLDFFKRGEVARDVRLLTAQGVITPRGEEQLAILILLLGDTDPEIQSAADATMNRIPLATLQAFLARPDIPTDCREFLVERGVVPDATADAGSSADADAPLIEAESSTVSSDEADELLTSAADESPADEATAPADDAASNEPVRERLVQQLSRMDVPHRVKAAMKGSREVRAILIRDPNKMIAAAVLSSPKVTPQEVASFAKMGNVSEDVLRAIGANRAWIRNYGVVSGLTRNPKTPIGLSLNLLSRLNDRDAQMLSMDRNVPGALRIAARKRTQDSVSKR